MDIHTIIAIGIVIAMMAYVNKFIRIRQLFLNDKRRKQLKRRMWVLKGVGLCIIAAILAL